MDAYSTYPPSKAKRPDSILEHFHDFIVKNADRICRLASISDNGAGESIVSLKKESIKQPGKVIKLERDANDDVFILDGQQLIFYKKNIAIIDGKETASTFLTNIWKDIAWEGIANEGGVTFRKGKKPERLVRRCIELTTSPGDLVLDSFAGSGTTGAVAHKMGRRWIMVELGEHCHTHIIPRLQKVINGEDQGGISKAVNWQGGGGFRYYKLAPSLIVNDHWGNQIINPAYNAAQLAEALAKIQGFTYQPSETLWWQHGYSSERDFIYVTTQNLSVSQLQTIANEVGAGRSLLICCSAFHGISAAQAAERWPNLTLCKIPREILHRCEWGHDDYSLNVANLPMATAEKAADSGDKAAAQGDLFAGDKS